MKEKSNRLEPILNAIAIALVVPLLILAFQTWSLAVQPHVAAGGLHTVGVKSDGTVVAVGHNHYGQCDVDKWTDIVQVATGDSHTVGVKFWGYGDNPRHIIPMCPPALGINRSGKLNLFNWRLYNDPEDYWTDERRRNAVPPDIGIVVP